MKEMSGDKTWQEINRRKRINICKNTKKKVENKKFKEISLKKIIKYNVVMF